MPNLIRIAEPRLLFRFGQSAEDPRDGLTLFGPLDEGKPYGIRAGIVGKKDSLRRFKTWCERLQAPIANQPAEIARPPFPGFEASFQIPWNPRPELEIQVPDRELDSIFLADKHQRVYQTVEIFSRRIVEAIRQEETKVDIWFVIIPDDVHKYCRPKSYIATSLQIHSEQVVDPARAKKLQSQPSLFPQDNIDAVPYHYEVNFHNQLKARLLNYEAPTQIIRESTIAPNEILNRFGSPLRRLDKLESAIAWGITTAAFYKAGGRPWKLSGIRDGVCYIGLVFKLDEKFQDPRSSCCAAQMFLDSGDGLVFKGDVGPWYSPEKGDFHMNRKSAAELVNIAVDSYVQKRGEPPKELFIHGKVRFDDDEWAGFQDPIDPTKTNLVGVRIRVDNDNRIYKKTDYPALRGLAYIRDERTAYLWTSGFVPRLQTYPGREVPRPLLVDVCRGRIQIQTVLADIMALTKLNYNSCIYADGQPVTLKFADAVGEILTAGPIGSIPPLQFKYYI